VRDIIVLKDKVTGQPRGCAFVSYATREEAEAAIRHLDRRVQLPGALNKLEVRQAGAQGARRAGAARRGGRDSARRPRLGSAAATRRRRRQ
jgi:RNA recognition motif-containing protein